MISNTTGTVWEWVSDWFQPLHYEFVPASGWENPKGPLIGVSRVLRGGSFFHSTYGLRSSDRYGSLPYTRSFNNGFRCAQ